ncbi:MAG TPA: hypothetical protein VMU84_21830 [Thermoanaerobaculia bacterium]|nr:hypothetical protein [Thermoanaerobaculia bacterium]
MHARVHRVLLPIILMMAAAVPAFAQDAPAQDDKIKQLEQKLDELLRQAAEIRQEIQQLKGPAEAGPTSEATDLTQVEVAQPSLTDVQPVANDSNPGAAKALNPDISVIGTFIGHAGDHSPLEEPRDPIALDEAEVAFEAFIDPYAKGKFFFALSPEGVELEEGYANFVALPKGFTAKVGKTKATFGKANTWHTHVRPWIDQPLVVHEFFGDEGLNDVGVSVSKTIANPWNAFIEATGEAYAGNVEGVFERATDNDLFYNAHLKLFKDISENSNIELGTSWARGNLSADSSGSNRFAGVDVTYRWKPLQRSIYNSFIARFEGIANHRADSDDTLRGFYASADYQFAQRWFTGARYDSVDSLEGNTDRGLSATLTFWPSEFSQIRGQYRRTRLGTGPSFDELLIQLQFAIGAHGAHVF